MIVRGYILQPPPKHFVAKLNQTFDIFYAKFIFQMTHLRLNNRLLQSTYKGDYIPDYTL